MLQKSMKLATEGQQDWVNLDALLKQHENSKDHCSNMVKWKEFVLRLSKRKTISETEMGLLEAEKNRWRDVLTCLISIIQSLAEGNLALGGSVDTLHQTNSGNFLIEVEVMAKCDPVLRDHVRRIDSGYILGENHSRRVDNLCKRKNAGHNGVRNQRI